ncbi:uncharacterized protein LOC109412744 [Aedes albopictus]|uniref:N-acetyltransferase domain-containing protein n=1 Tax=Aedes albopictus TaxID=7160 RepID=A0ABM1Z8R3_AEDAL|nr:uncharacterized protein LOC115259627 [Aedes albopictus]KXJ70647.1 hypothetical protein RP20_CCG022862 [Aedes albopictus]
MPWKRPSTVPYPKVWHRFQSRDVTISEPSDNHLVEYRVEDLTADRFEDALRHFTEHFAGDEPLAANRGVVSDPEAMRDHYDFWRWVFDQKMTIVCYKEGSDEIIGVNLLFVKLASDVKKDVVVRSQSTRDIVEIHGYMMTERFNVFNLLHVDQYLNAVGLAINRRYRGLGIATEMLRARIPICREFQIPVTVTDFTAQGSQRAAEKAGFRTEAEVTYEELARIRPNFVFPGIKDKSLKMMSLWVDRK